MKDRHQPETRRHALPADLAERLLARTAEIDSKQRIDAEIARLREASAEAGMLRSAFDAALAELRAEEEQPPAKATGRGRRRIQALVVAALVSLVAVVAAKRVVPSPAPGVEHAFQLQCIPARVAATVLTHSIDDGGVQLTIPPEGAPHVLTVRTATKEQMDKVRAALDQMTRSSCVDSGADRPVR